MDDLLSRRQISPIASWSRSSLMPSWEEREKTWIGGSIIHSSTSAYWCESTHVTQTVQDNKYRIMDNSTSCRCGPLMSGQKTGLLSLFICHSSHSVVVSPVISRWLTPNIRMTDWTTERDDAVIPLFPHPVRVVTSSHYLSCYSPCHYIILWFSCHVSLSHCRVTHHLDRKENGMTE